MQTRYPRPQCLHGFGAREQCWLLQHSQHSVENLDFLEKAWYRDVIMGRHTSARSATGRPFLFLAAMLRPYIKTYADPAVRVAHLRSKGLIIARPNVAAKKIEAIGYERLRIYFLSRRDQPEKRFRAGTTYQDIIQLYNCDAQLRTLCFEGVGRFELLFRNMISETLSRRYGSHPYSNVAAFRDINKCNAAQSQVQSIYSNSSDIRADHYRNTYNSPPLPPIWMFKEFLTFGSAAKFYSLLANDVRDEVANKFGISALPVFESWVACFVDLRNICAHHGRLFNRRFQKQPSRFRSQNVPSTTVTYTLKPLLECLDHSLVSAGENSQSVLKAERILRLAKYSAVNPAEAGF